MTFKFLNQKGVSAVEGLLVVLIVAVIAGTGYYVYAANKNANDTYKSANSSGTPKYSPKKQATQPTDETSKWFLYTSPNNKFSMRLPDGWQLQRYQDTDGMYAYGDTKLTPRPGVPATVTRVEGGKDGAGSGIFISFITTADDLFIDYEQFTKGKSFKTVSGLNVDVYSRTETEDPAGIGGVDKGGQTYHYVVTSSASKIVHLTYGFNPDEPDYHSTVEQAIKTITIN